MNNRTPDQLDEAIALARGWYVQEGEWFHPDRAWMAYFKQPYPPNFSRDWAHAGPLLEELASAGNWTVNIDSLAKGTEWLVYLQEGGENVFDILGRGDTLTEAIARAWWAWWAWKEEE